MRRFRAIAVTAAMLAIVSPAAAAPSALEVLGVVTNAARPVGNALVIALNLQDLATTQTTTGPDGRFVIQSLRSGIYKIIAVKQGFAPAITTIVPGRPSQRVALRLEQERKGSGGNQEMWELRASLPSDILREVEAILQPAVTEAPGPRFRGEMVSMTGVASSAASPAYASTALGVEGRLAGGWNVGVQGNLRRFEDPTDDLAFGPPVAESSGMSMELRSAGLEQSVRLASTQSSWMYADPTAEIAQADVRAHNIEWQRGTARLQVRYFEQDNLFHDLPVGSNLIEVSGNVPLLHTGRNGLGIGLRVIQETVESSTEPFRRADVSANGTVMLVPSLILHYGVASRIGVAGQQLAPRTGAEWKLTESTSLVGSATMKVVDQDALAVAVPSIVFWTEEGRVIPRYAYTVGFVSGNDRGRFSAVANVEAIDEPLRMVFADAQVQFWDGFVVDAGDIRRDIRVAYRREFGDDFAIDVATSAGSASRTDAPAGERAKVFVTGDLQSTYRPTGTTLAVSYRDIKQPRALGEEEYRAERLHVRMAQSLYLPVDIKLLLGLELARAENSPYLVDALDEEGRSRKYIGGLALNF